MSDGSNITPLRPRSATEPTPREAIGEVLRSERHDQHRTLADVAHNAGVSLAYLSEVERGTKDVSSEVLVAISRSLRIEVADVFERTATHIRFGSMTYRAHQRGSGPQLLAA